MIGWIVFNRFYHAALLSLALTAAIDKVAFSFPLLLSPQYLIGQASQVQDEVNLPYCYMQTADGRTLNLEKLCGKAANAVRPRGQNFRSRFPNAGTSSVVQSGSVSGLQLRLRSGSGYERDTQELGNL